MASKAISEFESVSKIQDNDLLLLSMSNNSTFKTKKITGENLKSSVLSGISIEQTAKEGTEIATIDINGKSTPIYMPQVDRGDNVYALYPEDKGTQIARITPSAEGSVEFYLCAPTTSFSSNMSDGILLGTIIADDIESEIRCPSGIGQSDIIDSCKIAIDSKLEYLDQTDELRVNDKKFKIHDSEFIKDSVNQSICDSVSFDNDTSTLTIGDDFLKIPNIDCEELKDLIDESVKDNVKDGVEKGILSSRSAIEDMVKTGVSQSSGNMQEAAEKAIEAKLYLNSSTNEYTVGNNIIYVSKLTTNDVVDAVTSKISVNSSNNDLIVNDSSIHIPKLSEISYVGNSYPYLDSTQFSSGTFYKGSLKSMVVGKTPTSLISKNTDTEEKSNQFFKFQFVSNYYIKLNVEKTTCIHSASFGFVDSSGNRYEFGKVNANTSGYLTWEGYVKKDTIMYVSIHTDYEKTGDSVLMYPVL